MALSITYQWRSHNTTWQSGQIYQFHYSAYQHDPRPLIILLYRIKGTHPNTGNAWNLFQAINFNYIPTSHRKLFFMIWSKTLNDHNGDLKFTYQMVKQQFPFLKYGVRRYMLNPVYRITQVQSIPPDQAEEAVVSSFDKDFSKKVKMDLINKYNNIKDSVSIQNKKTETGIKNMGRSAFGSTNMFGGLGSFFRNMFKRRK